MSKDKPNKFVGDGEEANALLGAMKGSKEQKPEPKPKRLKSMLPKTKQKRT